ncbi:MAG TPA: hypothetical protein VF028_00125 [Actinomycetota bacterium]|nr:hypothetical protein [Actinomycetota bacterium]
MAENGDRVQEALAAYLEYLEMGGREPETDHLDPKELDELRGLIAALELTEGVEFGLGRDRAGERGKGASPRQGASEQLLAQLREELPPDARVESDAALAFSHVGGIEVTDAWIVGTFGGRIRVWLLAIGTAQELEANNECLPDLDRAFGALPDTSAVALVAEDLSCLIVLPEDCAPQITIPSGSLLGRGYRRPVRPAADAIGDLLSELIPYWDPIPAFESDPASIGSAVPSDEHAAAAIEEQRAIGQRARKGNPKKDVLLALGDEEASTISGLIDGLIDGSVDPEDIEERIERSARDR